MTGYVTISQMVERFGEAALVQLTDRAEPLARVIDETVLGRAIADASAMVDGYIAARYPLPLAAVPPLLVGITAALAYANLHTRTVPDKVAEDARVALRALQDIARGLVQLNAGTVAVPAQASPQSVAVAGSDRVFSRDTLRAF